MNAGPNAQKIPLLELRDICKHYESGEITVRALDGVSLTINKGEFIAIMGQSGSGKSTLMNIIGCLDSPSSGSYRVLGRQASQLGPDQLSGLRRQVFGFVFQRYNLLGNATAEENVEIPALYAGVPKTERKNNALKLLTRLGIGDRAGHKPAELSGGQQQRVAIARALMNDPPVILADEPTGALDSRSGEEVLNLLKELHAEGRTIILITHDEKIAAHAKRVIHISDGKIISDGGVEISAMQTAATLEEKEIFGVLDIAETMRMSLRSLRANIFRTMLTLLGIIIGVAAVITLLAVGNGSKQEVISQISSMGTNLLTVRPGAPNMRRMGNMMISLTADDAKAIAAIDNVELVVPERSGSESVRYGNTDATPSINGVGDKFSDLREWPVEKGTFFNEGDVKSYAAVALIGQTTLKNFFSDGQDPIGKYILIKNIPFEVIGVMKAKGAAPWGGDQDDAVFIPYTTGMMRVFGMNFLSSISVKVKDISQIDKTEEDINKLLLERHHTEDFNVRNMASLLETVNEAQNNLTVMLGAVAAISLLVGGIGVMNIMLVSVTERTREIGVRMATGARKFDILLQFNVEAAVVCAIGGAIGIVMGLLSGLALQFFGMTILFTVAPAILAFTSAFATGIIFGFLPAHKAANLNPVTALASE